jgi:hypothetical protein
MKACGICVELGRFELVLSSSSRVTGAFEKRGTKVCGICVELGHFGPPVKGTSDRCIADALAILSMHVQ